MKIHLILNGLDPVKELARHDALAAKYRAEMTMFRLRNWKRAELLRSAIYHEESAAALRKEGA